MAKRSTVWTNTHIDELVVANGEAIPSLMGDYTTRETQGWTLTRLISYMWVQQGVVGTVVGSMRLDFGVGVVSQDAFTASAVPDPSTPQEEPPRGWVYKDALFVSDHSTDGLITPSSREVRADIRAARKVEGGELVMVINNTVFGGATFTVQVAGLVRCLFLLS